MRNSIWILLLLLFVISCDKRDDNNEDYRDNFIGEYGFTTCSIIEEYNHQLDTMYISYDTIKAIGSISKNGNEKLTIIFQSHETEPDLDSTNFKPLSLGKIYPTVDLNGILSYPEFIKYGGGIVSFEGQFINSDTINFMYGYVAHSFTYKYNVTGIKTTHYE